MFEGVRKAARKMRWDGRVAGGWRKRVWKRGEGGMTKGTGFLRVREDAGEVR